MNNETLTQLEEFFLSVLHDPERRKVLLERLEQLGLLDSFLEAEKGGQNSEKSIGPIRSN